MLKDLINSDKEKRPSKLIETEKIKDLEKELEKYYNGDNSQVNNHPYAYKVISTFNKRNNAYISKASKPYFEIERGIGIFYTKSGIFLGNGIKSKGMKEIYVNLNYQILIDIMGYNHIFTNTYNSEYSKEVKSVINKVTERVKILALKELLTFYDKQFNVDPILTIKNGSSNKGILKQTISELEDNILKASINSYRNQLGLFPIQVEIFGEKIEVKPEDIGKKYYYERFLEYVNELEGTPQLKNRGLTLEPNKEIEMQEVERQGKDEIIGFQEVDVGWVNYLKEWINNYRDNTIYNYKRPNKKLSWTKLTLASPTVQKRVDTMKELNIYIDVSTSVDITKLRYAFSHLNYLFSNFREEINAYTFTTEVKSLDFNEISKDSERIMLNIGGGTDLKQTLKHINEFSDMKSVNIIITDGKVNWKELKRELFGRRVAILVTGELNKEVKRTEGDIKIFKI